EHRDLGATAHLARGRANLDDALLDLGDLELEQRLHEHAVGAAQNQPRSLGSLFDSLQHRANGLALVIVLAMVLFAVRNDRLRPAELVEHHHELAALDLLNLTREKIANAARELVADARAFPFAYALN